MIRSLGLEVKIQWVSHLFFIQIKFIIGLITDIEERGSSLELFSNFKGRLESERI